LILTLQSVSKGRNVLNIQKGKKRFLKNLMPWYAFPKEVVAWDWDLIDSF